MSISKGVIGIFSAVVGALVGAGIIIPSKTAEPLATKPKIVASMTVTESAPAQVQIQKPPVDPIDPDPTPTPRPTPVPTPKPTLPAYTIGCQFPPIYDKWWLHSTDQAAYLAGLVENNEYRTNVMFNWEGHFQHEIQATSATGVVLGSLTFDTYLLEPCTADNVTNRDGVCSGMFQLNKFVEQIDATYSGVYSIQVKPLGGTGRIFFYATMIDNRSSDCTMYSQFRRTKNNNVWSEGGLYYQASFDAETENP